MFSEHAIQESVFAGGGARRLQGTEKLTFPVLLFILWLVMEYCRPPSPMRIPLMISLTYLGVWLIGERKIWPPQIVAIFFLLVQMTLMIPFTENYFDALMVTKTLFVNVICIAVPIAHFITSLKQFEVVLRCWAIVFLYMAVVAVMNGGNGPGGARAGVDENYTAVFMTVAIANIYFLQTVTKHWVARVSLLGIAGLCVAATVAGFSRGGFLGLAAAIGYCLWTSPRRWQAAVVGVALIPVGLLWVPQEYWREMTTIGDLTEGTAELRIIYWSIATRMFLDHPIFGVGPGNFKWVSDFYQSVDANDTALGMNLTHSLYFELLAELGTAGVIMLATIVYFNAKALLLVWRAFEEQRGRLDPLRSQHPSAEEKDHVNRLRKARAFAGGLTGSFIGFLVCSLFLSTLYYSTFWLLTGLTVALRESTVAELARFRDRRGTADQAPIDRLGSPDEGRRPSMSTG